MTPAILPITLYGNPTNTTLTIVGTDGVSVEFDHEHLHEAAPNLLVECWKSSLFASRELRCLEVFLRTGSLPDELDPPPLETLLQLIDFSGAFAFFQHLVLRDLDNPVVVEYFKFALRPELNTDYLNYCVASLTEDEVAVQVKLTSDHLHIDFTNQMKNSKRTLNALKLFCAALPQECATTVSLRFVNNCAISSDEFRSIIDHLGDHCTLLRTVICSNLCREDLEYAFARCPLEHIDITPCECDIDMDGLESDTALLSSKTLVSIIDRYPNLRVYRINRRYDSADTTALLVKILACCSKLEILELKCQGITAQFLNSALARNPNLRVLSGQTTDESMDFRLLDRTLIASHAQLETLVYWDGNEQVLQFNEYFQGIANKSISMYRYWNAD